MIGRTISHYKITEKLGEGGMGVVYKAEDTRLGRTVALKFLTTHLVQDEEALRRFEREAKAAAALDHPNICTIYEIDQADGQTFLAMAFVDGKTVSERIAERPLKLDEALHIAIQTAQGLQAAHQKGVVHRDIKSDNLMVTPDGQVKIMDFGLAQLSDQARLTKTATRLGTPAYMSPEQAQGRPTDRRTDIWSVGVVTYEMVTGRVPFEGERAQGILYSIVHEEPEAPTELRSHLPIELDRILDKALAKSADDRYQHVEDLAVDLKALRRESSTRSVRGVSTTKFARRERLPQWYKTAALLVVLLAAISVYFGTARNWFDGEESIAVLPFANLSPEADDEYLASGLAEEIINQLTKLEGVRVVSRTSTLQFSDPAVDLQQVGERLQVRTVLTGGVRRERDRVRVSTQLVRVEDGTQIWSEVYERELEDVFVVQAQIAEAVAAVLRVKLRDSSSPSSGEEDPVAYDLYLRGRFQSSRVSPASQQQAIGYYERALERDPNYARAYAGLARAYAALTLMGTPSADLIAKATDAAGRALALDDSLGEAHTALGSIKQYYEWDWAGAEGEFQRALALNPRDTAPYFAYAGLLMNMMRLQESRKWGIHLTQVAPRRCGLVDPWTPAHCTQNAPWGARRRSAGNWATRLRFGPIKDYARAMAIAGLETWCYRQAFPGAANGQPQYVVVT